MPVARLLAHFQQLQNKRLHSIPVKKILPPSCQVAVSCDNSKVLLLFSKFGGWGCCREIWHDGQPEVFSEGAGIYAVQATSAVSGLGLV